MKGFRFWRRDDGSEGGSGEAGHDDPTGLLTGDPAEDAKSIEVLLHSIAEVNASIDLDEVLQDIVDRSLEVTAAERGILLLGGTSDDLQIRVARDRQGRALGTDLVYSQTLVQRCLENRQAERSVVQSDREALQLGQSVFDLKLRAVMCAPLETRGRVIGVIYVDSTAVRREFSARDLALFGALSAQLATAIENARLHADSLEKVRLQKDFEIAKRIQQHLMPAVPRDYTALDIAVRFQPRDEASGDTYDLIPCPGGELVAVIGDVTGHGVGAALLTHAAQAALRSYVELLSDLGDIATRLNTRLAASVEAGNFISLVLLRIDPTGRSLRYVNAGHPAPLLVRGDEVRELEKTGMVLGVVAEQEYASAGPVELRPGDLLFLRSDGVDETRDAERGLFGTDRLEAVLRACAGLGAEAVLDRVDAALLEFARGERQDDDLTMLAIRLPSA